MRIHAVRFFLIFSFIVAQFFTQQLHDFAHLNASETDVAALHAVNGSSTATFQEKHEHCKFLRIIANQHAQPFLVLDPNSQTHILVIQKIKPPTIHNWISYSDSSYHQARAPPAA